MLSCRYCLLENISLRSFSRASIAWSVIMTQDCIMRFEERLAAAQYAVGVSLLAGYSESVSVFDWDISAIRRIVFGVINYAIKITYVADRFFSAVGVMSVDSEHVAEFGFLAIVHYVIVIVCHDSSLLSVRSYNLADHNEKRNWSNCMSRPSYIKRELSPLYIIPCLGAFVNSFPKKSHSPCPDNIYKSDWRENEISSLSGGRI